jgi:hypothetical protein
MADMTSCWQVTHIKKPVSMILVSATPAATTTARPFMNVPSRLRRSFIKPPRMSGLIAPDPRQRCRLSNYCLAAH